MSNHSPRLGTDGDAAADPRESAAGQPSRRTSTDRTVVMTAELHALPSLLTVAETAEVLRVGRNWVYEHATELGAIKLGRGRTAPLRIPRDEVRRIVGAHPPQRDRRSPPRGEPEKPRHRTATCALGLACSNLRRMPRQPTGQIREHTSRNGVVSYGVRFRGRGYPAETIRLGRSDEGMTRAGAEHEARLIASQILAGTWSPPLKADYAERDVPTIGQLADEHYQRKIRKGLRPNSLADMKRKLEIHLLPHFSDIPVSELTSRDIESYLDRKLAENRRIEAALRDRRTADRRPRARASAAAAADDQLTPASTLGDPRARRARGTSRTQPR